MAKLIRAIGKGLEAVLNFVRILHLRIKYPGASISFSSYIEKNCRIACIDGGRLQIRNSRISQGSLVFCDEKGTLSIQDSFIGFNCVIVAKHSITIGSGCAIAEMVVIRDQDHQVDTNNPSDAFACYNVGKIDIRRNVWIASKATVLRNVTVGEYAVIAASAVVNTSVPAYEIWGGVPAKFIKKANE